MYYDQRTLLSRLCIFGIILGISLSALALIFLSHVVHQRMADRQLQLTELTDDLLLLTVRMQGQCQLAMATWEDCDRALALARVNELSEEAEEISNSVLGIYRALKLDASENVLRRDMGELRALVQRYGPSVPLDRDGLAHLGQEVETLEGLLLGLQAQAETAVAQEMKDGAMLMLVAGGFLVLDLLLGALGLLLAVSDLIYAAVGPVKVEEILRKIEASEEFQCQM